MTRRAAFALGCITATLAIVGGSTIGRLLAHKHIV